MKLKTNEKSSIKTNILRDFYTTRTMLFQYKTDTNVEQERISR